MSTTDCTLGHEMRDSFLLDPEGTFINHGSYGAIPKTVQTERFRLMEQQERRPDEWCRELHLRLWKQNLDAIARFLGSKTENLVFVNNATTGINTVLRSLKFEPGDAILTHNYTYKAVRNACIYVARRSGAEVLTVDIRPPIAHEDEVVDKYDRFLADHPQVKLVVLDYISSMPAIQFPVKKLVPVFRKYGVIILVDGAHTPGQVALNLEDMGVDFYTGNLHKWLFTPRPCAVLWLHPKFRDVIRPLVISGSLDHEDIMYDFHWQGTVDHTSFFCTEKAIAFVKSIGEQSGYIAYCSELADKAADLLVRRFGTEKFALPRSMEAPFMKLIKLPKLPKYPATKEVEGDIGTIFRDMDAIMPIWHRFRIQTVTVSIHGEPWLRISCNVYNSIEDYEKLADCILEMANETE